MGRPKRHLNIPVLLGALAVALAACEVEPQSDVDEGESTGVLFVEHDPD